MDMGSLYMGSLDIYWWIQRGGVSELVSLDHILKRKIQKERGV